MLIIILVVLLSRLLLQISVSVVSFSALDNHFVVFLFLDDSSFSDAVDDWDESILDVFEDRQHILLCHSFTYQLLQGILNAKVARFAIDSPIIFLEFAPGENFGVLRLKLISIHLHSSASILPDGQ